MSANSSSSQSTAVLISDWLLNLELPRCYEDVIKRNVPLEDVPHLDEAKLKVLGVANLFIRKQIVAKLDELRELLKDAPIEMPVATMSAAACALESYDVPRVSSPNCTPQQPTYYNHMPSSPLLPELCQQPYYHGRLKRIDAEQLVEEDGNFLVRDCISSPGDFVLTCRWRANCLHFQINRVALPSADGELLTLYQFEAEQFDRISDLIDFYRSHQKPITEGSKCQLRDPIVRLKDSGYSPSTSSLSNSDSPGSLSGADYASMAARHLPFLPSEDVKVVTKANPNLVQRPLPKLPKATPLIQKWSSEVKLAKMRSASSMHCNSAEDLRRSVRRSDTPRSDRAAAPPKPFRPDSWRSSYDSSQRSSVLTARSTADTSSLAAVSVNVDSSHLDEDDKDDYDQIDYEQMDSPTFHPSPSNGLLPPEADSNHRREKARKLLDFTPSSAAKPRLPPRTTQHAKLTPPTSTTDRDSACVLDYAVYDEPVRESKRISANENDLDPDGLADYSILPPPVPVAKRCSRLLQPCEPLEPDVLVQCSNVLRSTSADAVANALTETDLGIIAGNLTGTTPHSVTAKLTGLARILLPEEEELRLAVLERAYSLECFVLLTICKTVPEAEKLAIGLKWLDCADVLWKQLGNHFSFASIMRALVRTQLRRKEEQLWREIASSHSSLMRNLEQSLIPGWKAVEKGDWCANDYEGSAVTIPFVQNVAKWLSTGLRDDRSLFDGNPASLEAVWNILQNARRWHDLSPSSAERIIPAKELDDSTIRELASCAYQVQYIVGERDFNQTSKIQRVAQFSRLLNP